MRTNWIFFYSTRVSKSWAPRANSHNITLRYNCAARAVELFSSGSNLLLDKRRKESSAYTYRLRDVSPLLHRTGRNRLSIAAAIVSIVKRLLYLVSTSRKTERAFREFSRARSRFVRYVKELNFFFPLKFSTRYPPRVYGMGNEILSRDGSILR